jgi:ribonucleoside-diphosphate reductase alpha chain
MAMERRETACGPCGTISLSAHADGNGSISWDRFEKTVALSVMALDNVISLTHFPSTGAERHCMRMRSIGLSVGGLHDLLRANSIPFDSPEAERIAAAIFEHLGYFAVQSSAKLAEERGPIPEGSGAVDRLPGEPDEGDAAADLDWGGLRDRVRRSGLRNAYLLAGSAAMESSTILAVSPGTLPLQSNVRTMQLPSGERICTLDAALVRRLQSDGLWSTDLAGGLCHLEGDLHAFPELPQELRSVFSTAFDCDPGKLIDLAASIQRRIDQSQHLPCYVRMPTFFHLSALLQHAWKSGIKVIGPLVTTHAVAREKALVGKKIGTATR